DLAAFANHAAIWRSRLAHLAGAAVSVLTRSAWRRVWGPGSGAGSWQPCRSSPVHGFQFGRGRHSCAPADLRSGGICAPTSAPLVGSHLSKGVSRTGGRFLALLMKPIRRVLSLPSDCFPKALRPRRTVPLPSTAGALFYSMAAAGDLATRCQTVQCR